MFATLKPSPVLSQSSGTYRNHSPSPFKTARFSPYKLPQNSSSASPLPNLTHPHPDASLPEYILPTVSDIPRFVHKGEEFLNTIHVKLDFELFSDGEQCTPSTEQWETIMGLFPTCFRLSFTPPFLVLACSELPAKPWPVTVAGMPLYLTTDIECSPMDLGLSARGPKASVEASIQRWQTPEVGTFEKIFILFDKLHANIHRLQWIGWGFLALGVSEPFADWRARLPFLINNIRIGYIFGEQNLHEKALRRKLPTGRVPDDELYSDLRPGVMITSKSLYQAKYDVMTTSGVCLQSPSGTKYITVAKHGFPGGIGDHVLHPSRDGHHIAEVDKIFGETDIALAKLADVHYSRETFSADDAPVRPFRHILDSKQTRIGDLVFMDTPFNGRCEGVLTKLDVLRTPSDESTDSVKYVLGCYTYFGNGADTLFDGCCGGVIWNSDHDILGQFGFQQEGSDLLCYCPSFEILRSYGYTLSDA